MREFSFFTASAVSQTHGVQIHPVLGDLLPDDGLQVGREGPVAPGPAQHEGPVVVEHRVVAAPDHDGPLVVLRDPHPLPVLDLGDDGGLGLGVVVSQHPGVGPVHHRNRHQQITLRVTVLRDDYGCLHIQKMKKILKTNRISMIFSRPCELCSLWFKG